MKTEELYKIYLAHPFISTDTRSIKEGSIFFALKGEHFDANLFAQKALDEGCSFAVVDKPELAKDQRFLVVDDVLKSLQDLARYHRSQLNIPVLGITGTNGKTTTKELLHAVLSQRYKTTATAGNLNNHIGVPLTLLSIPKETEFAIVEMGANHLGEIADLCEMAQPNFGLITNIGKAHLEGFGSVEGIIETKTALYKAVQKNKGVIFVNAENELLMELSQPYEKRITYGVDKADFVAELESFDPTVSLMMNGQLIRSQLSGIYNVENILAAATVGHYFDVDESQIKTALEAYKPTNNRSQILKNDRYTLVLDAYNANPTSMYVAIDSFSLLHSPQKFLILGDMLELGEASFEEHQRIVDLLKEKQLDHFVLVGTQFMQTNAPSSAKFESWEKAAEFLKTQDLTGFNILIKGSRGIKLENIAKLFEA